MPDSFFNLAMVDTMEFSITFLYVTSLAVGKKIEILIINQYLEKPVVPQKNLFWYIIRDKKVPNILFKCYHIKLYLLIYFF